MPKSQTNKTGFNIIWLHIFIFVENWIQYDTIHDFHHGLEPVLIQRILIGLNPHYKIYTWSQKGGGRGWAVPQDYAQK